MRTLTAKREKAKNIVHAYATGAAGTAIATGPIPGTSVMLTGLEAKMVYDVARVYDFRPTLEEAGTTIAALVAASGGLKHLAIEVSACLPVVGWWLIKPGIAAGACEAVGKIAIEHYEEKYRSRPALRS